MLRVRTSAITIALAATFLAACEQPYQPSVKPSEPANVHLNITTQATYDATTTRSPEPLTDHCTNINVAVYSQGIRVISLTQKATDADFGQVAFHLPEGFYTMTILGHNSEAAATTTDPTRVTFKNNLVTDTFIHTDSFTVTDQPVTHDVILTRCVAKVQFDLPQPLSTDIHSLKFYYTGGSSTLSALTTYGSVNSRQTVVIPNQQQLTYSIYTFPHAETGLLKLTVTSLAADGTTIQELTPRQVPVQRNCITRFATDLFGDPTSTPATRTTTILCDPAWTDTYTYTW